MVHREPHRDHGAERVTVELDLLGVVEREVEDPRARVPQRPGGRDEPRQEASEPGPVEEPVQGQPVADPGPPDRPTRSERDRVVAGVAGGIAEYLGWSPLLVRLLWILALIPGGIPGILPYVVCWLIIPSESRTRTWS